MTFDLALLQRQPVEVTDAAVRDSAFHTMVHMKRHFCLPRWFSSSERDQIALPKPDEASLCPCSLSKASTMTLSSAHLPLQTRSWKLEPTFTALRPCPAQRSHCSLLRTKANAWKCLSDWRSCYWPSKSAPACYRCIPMHFFTLTHSCVNRLKYNSLNQVRVMISFDL